MGGSNWWLNIPLNCAGQRSRPKRDQPLTKHFNPIPYIVRVQYEADDQLEALTDHLDLSNAVPASCFAGTEAATLRSAPHWLKWLQMFWLSPHALPLDPGTTAMS